ncbi:unnamed protein product, partial [Urochloa humidicola]
PPRDLRIHSCKADGARQVRGGDGGARGDKAAALPGGVAARAGGMAARPIPGGARLTSNEHPLLRLLPRFH